MLLLGAVAIFEPVNGYQIRRELMTWGVEDWANIKPGSIYNGLATLAQRGELVRHDLRDGSREVAVYELSDKGREEFTPADGGGHRPRSGRRPRWPSRRRSRCCRWSGAPMRCGCSSSGSPTSTPPPRGTTRRPPTSSTSRRTSLAMMDYWERVGEGRARVAAPAALPDRGRRAGLPRRADGLDAGARRPGAPDERRPGALPRHAAGLNPHLSAACPAKSR